MTIQAPFPYFGKKSKIAPLVWQYFDGVRNYVEPFCGSLAVLLAGPTDIWRTVNDVNGYISNFWRSVQWSPDETAHYADWPTNENDMHARRYWLVQQRDDLVERLEGDHKYHDPKIAGYWVWVASNSFGGAGGCCETGGPWHSMDSKLIKGKSDKNGIQRGMPHCGRNLGIMSKHDRATRLDFIKSWFRDLQKRLDRVRVCCGDWQRVCGYSVTTVLGTTGVFLDPPYLPRGQDKNVYGYKSGIDPGEINNRLHSWCRENQDNPKMRIVLCGQTGDYDLPEWTQIKWKRLYDGFGKGKNRDKEVLWLSPHTSRQRMLF